jgi:putative ABC transport system permease protein
MGLRLALGAAARDVITLVIAPSAAVALAGAGAGLAAAFGLTRYLEMLLFGVQPGDPTVVTAAAVTLVIVALVAALIPVRRAIRVDPASALRQD